MEHLLPLLLPLLLAMCSPGCSRYTWNRQEGGGEAKPPSRTHPTPYMAYLQGKDDQFCGGFLVAPSWVMTAAQCLNHKPLTVILGAQTLQRREESWQTFKVKEYHRHPDFTSPKKGNDILLLKLNGSATSTSHVRPISFETCHVRGGTKCSVVGWGYGTPAVTLREATVTIIKQRDCLNQYPGLVDNMICGRSKSAGIPEKGDVGDPLVCNNKACGIFSYKHNNWPGFYTNIFPYVSWANSVMKSA